MRRLISVRDLIESEQIDLDNTYLDVDDLIEIPPEPGEGGEEEED